MLTLHAYPYDMLLTHDESFTNPRVIGHTTTELRELGLSIGRSGLWNPLRVTATRVIMVGRGRHSAIGMLLDWRNELVGGEDGVQPSEAALFDMRATELRAAVPCILHEGGDVLATALGDNIVRTALHTFDIAAALAMLHAQGQSYSEIGRKVGRHRTYVSRMIDTYHHAIPRLIELWKSDAIPYDQVRQLAEQSPERQAELLESGKRGSHGRPGVDALKGLLSKIRKEHTADDQYAAGVVDALRIATGEMPIEALRRLL